MSRDTSSRTNKIALLATGDEIIQGDIQNTNSQIIAQKLFAEGMQVGIHMTVSDTISEICDAILFLLQSHRGLIITGGLGPTSDDVTRYGLAKALTQPLIFNDHAWDAICARFKLFGYSGNPPESNRQQALFPEHATIIENSEGTASGCILEEKNNYIFMLPGPPSECLPMIEKKVLPILKNAKFQNKIYYDSWLLFGVSEGKIAEELDALAQSYDCMTGYRLAYPYIEFKIFSNNEKDFKAFQKIVEKHIAPFLLNTTKKTASDLFKENLKKSNLLLTINDSATGGLLQTIMLTPETYPYLRFNSTESDITITGLIDYWERNNSKETQLKITLKNQNIIKKIPLSGREKRVLSYAVEVICQQLNNFIS